MNEVLSEINDQCDRLDLDAKLYASERGSDGYLGELERILLYLLCKIDGNIDGYDEERAMALINRTEYEKCRANNKKFEERQAEKADAAAPK